jgi:2-dehydro-3-deoxyphosphogalactonate aldolase
VEIDEILSAGLPPIMAILRGLRPEQAPAIGSALVEAGIRIIEVPLNSPDPFASIARLQETLGDVACIGAGTVLDAVSVDKLAATGARLMVTPNTDAQLIALGLSRGLQPMPGFLTPSEAFIAINAGARRLKLFPSMAFSPAYLRAIREVIPRDIAIWAVGGTGVGNIRDWLDAGSQGIGVGTALYRPGDDAAVVAERASQLVDAWRTGSGKA